MSLLVDGGFLADAEPMDYSSSDPASSTSTPPTTVADSADNASLHSDTCKNDVITVADDVVFTADNPLPLLTPPHEDDDQTRFIEQPLLPDAAAAQPSPPRSRPSRFAAAHPVYNMAMLSGTAAHGKRRANGDVCAEPRRRTISTLDRITGTESPQRPSRARANNNASGTIDALDLHMTSNKLQSPRAPRQKREPNLPPPLQTRRSAAAAAAAATEALNAKGSVLGKRSRKSNPNVPRELRRLQDTKEFSHIDEKPIIYTVWSNGKYVDPSEVKTQPPPRKKVKADEPEREEKEDSEPVTNTRERRVKKYLERGLYSGQEAPPDPTKYLSLAEKKKLTSLPELVPTAPHNKLMPLPVYQGFRELLNGRDFRLPFQICNPLPPGQPKPDEWKKMTKNRFIGESRDYWRKTPHILDYQSKCVCKPEDGCAESCQNRIMLYECDKTNCNIGPELCTNRAFADLTARRAKGGKYRVGVEVIKTSDRGYGVRSNRCFEPNQIIMEYAGEIITEEECERRMNEEYKDNECYYLMSFDQNMIIDATTGSIARFVNHSCNPNCRMIKWIVSGQPRMALFAGDRPIMTGDELTYDYNFDPFSAKNVQKCLCGSHNCRGVLGPKKHEVKPVKVDAAKLVKGSGKAAKRKLDNGHDGKQVKKAKTQLITTTKSALAKVSSMQAAKERSTAAKLKKKHATSKITKTLKSGVTKRKTTASSIVKKTTTATRITKTYGSKTQTTKKKTVKASPLSPGKGLKTPPKKKAVAIKLKDGAAGKKTPVEKATVSKVAVKKGPVKKVVLKRTSAAAKASPKKKASRPVKKAKAPLDFGFDAAPSYDSVITVAGPV